MTPSVLTGSCRIQEVLLNLSLASSSLCRKDTSLKTSLIKHQLFY
ncbi:MAG: hypothetical protein ACTS73_08335 [Arsenophonus sp. NEOnobi-MAG3]